MLHPVSDFASHTLGSGKLTRCDLNKLPPKAQVMIMTILGWQDSSLQKLLIVCISLYGRWSSPINIKKISLRDSCLLTEKGVRLHVLS